MKTFGQWLSCVIALFLATYMFPGQVHNAGLAALIAAGTVLWLVNLLIRPVIRVLSLPLSVVTLGLFSFVVNALMVKLAVGLIPGISIKGFFVCLVVSILVSIMNMVLVKK